MKKLLPFLFAILTACGPSNLPTKAQETAAEEIRTYLLKNEIPSVVYASREALTVDYTYGRIEFVPDTFMKQIGEDGKRRLIAAGFQRIEIKARNADEKWETKEIPLK